MSSKEADPPTPDRRCGTTAGYQAHSGRGERACQPCRTAQSDWMRHYRTRMYLAGGPMRVDATGTRRRLNALARIGWPADLLAAELGRKITGSAVRNWANHKGTSVHRRTAEQVAALYDRLWDKPGPSAKVAGKARAMGWPPPMAWDDDTIDDPKARPCTGWTLGREGGSKAFDEIAVERAMRGEAVRLRPVERTEAVRRLTELGFSAAQIADRLRINQRSATRLRGAEKAA